MRIAGGTVPLFLLAAFFAGLVDAMAGGGGLISLPALLAAGLPPHFAQGTNKIQSCLGTSFSTARYLRHGHVHGPVALTAAAGALAGSYLGSLAALALPSERLAAKVLWGAALPMGLANITGNWLGAGLAIRGGARVIKPVFGFVLLLLFVRITVLH